MLLGNIVNLKIIFDQCNHVIFSFAGSVTVLSSKYNEHMCELIFGEIML
jgi:hypothetical protein